MITGIIIGEMKNRFSTLLPGKDPLTKASDAINPRMRETKVVIVATLKLRRVGITHR